MNKKLLVIHGPNLNLLGKREKHIYGEWDLERINREIENRARTLGLQVEIYQSNHEGEIVEKIQQAQCDIIIINPAAYTHTSVAIRDALLSVKIPAIEVHMTNVYKRELFRHYSFVSDIVMGKIVGFGAWSYILAIEAAAKVLKES